MFPTDLHALLEVGALELAGEAGHGRAVGLVHLVEAVVVAVAHPRRRDAVPRARTRELRRGGYARVTKLKDQCTLFQCYYD